MTETTSLAAEPRTIVGKANRRLAAEGKIPAVLYGPTREPVALSVNRHDFELFMSHAGGGSTLVSLLVEGESKPINAIIKELQVSPVKGSILHVDFQAIRMDRKISATVSLHLVGDSQGVKEGGILMHNLHTVHVEALPGDLPEAIEVDISGLELGDTLHVSDVVAPENVEIVDEPEAIVCSVTTPSAEPVEEEVLEEGEEPELVGEEGEEASAEESQESEES